MASGEFSLGSSKNLEGKIVWNSVSNGSSANTSNVYAEIYVRRPDGYQTTGTFNFSLLIHNRNVSASLHCTVGGSWVLLGSRLEKEISHANDGTCDCYIGGTISGPSGTSQEGAYIDHGQYCTLDKIPRYASISHSLNSTGLNSAKINWSSDSTCDLLQYSLNSGAWKTVTGNPYTISGLNPNTNYKVKTRVRRKDSQLYSQTGDLSFNTKDIGKISSLSNFTHGSSVTIGITNPSGQSLNLVMKIDSTQIFSKTVTTSTKSISFTDTELDNIYKSYGSSSSLTATFILTTAGSYTNTKTCTVTLNGNQKTARINVNNSWKRGKVFTNVNGSWKKAVAWTNVNGTWRRCI